MIAVGIGRPFLPAAPQQNGSLPGQRPGRVERPAAVFKLAAQQGYAQSTEFYQKLTDTSRKAQYAAQLNRGVAMRDMQTTHGLFRQAAKLVD